MKKFFINIITFMLLITTTFSLVGCGALGNFSERNNYNSDVKEVLPEDITNEHFIPEENKTYYTSDKFQIVISVKGNFMVMDYFTIDGEKRIYDNLFFYEEDYLFVIINI